MAELAASFRAEILTPLIALLQAGESCSLVGVGDCGKSRLARFLARPDVGEHYFGGGATPVLGIYLNCKSYAALAPHEFYLYILDQLITTATHPDGNLRAGAAELDELCKHAQTNPALFAMRDLDKAADVVLRAGAKQIILILDDWDDLCSQAPTRLFSDLRALRDNHKRVLVFVTLTRRELAYLRKPAEFEEFFDLFSFPGHTLALPFYTESDSIAMAKSLAADQKPARELSEAEARRLHELSGGHAGLLRAIIYFGNVLAADIVDRLIAEPNVHQQCRKIWTSLEPEERDDLERIITREAATPAGLNRLLQRGLIRMRYALYPEIFSPVFLRFVVHSRGLSVPDVNPIDLSLPAPQVRVWGQLITNLTHLEYELLRYVHSKQPECVPISELLPVIRLAEHRAPAEMEPGNPLHRIEMYVAHLKAKLGLFGDLVRREGDAICLRM